MRRILNLAGRLLNLLMRCHFEAVFQGRNTEDSVLSQIAVRLAEIVHILRSNYSLDKSANEESNVLFKECFEVGEEEDDSL